MKIVFFGSSDFSVPALKACLKPPYHVLLVISTPDQKKGRGLKTFPTPVRQFAEDNKLETICPASLKDPLLLETVKKLEPDLFVVSSYGKIIPSSWLKVPKLYSLNVHPSLLPKYRGASPINAPILNGDQETGISIMEVAPRLDAGDVFAQVKYPLSPTVTAEELSEDLAIRSYDLLLDVLKQIDAGDLTRTPQDETLATYAAKLEKEDGRVDWSQSAQRIANQVRGLLPWPVAYASLHGEPLQIYSATPSNQEFSKSPGEIVNVHKTDGLLVQTGKGTLRIETVKPAGKKVMLASAFAHGKHLKPGQLFDVTTNPSKNSS